MSVPPQQPGQPDPYGTAQPGGFEQQQGGYNQLGQTGRPRPGSDSPDTGPASPLQGTYPQPPLNYTQPFEAVPGYPEEPAAPVRRKVPAWALAGGGVVLVGVVVALLFVFGVFGASPTSSPDGVAKAAADALNKQDTTALNKLACAGSAVPNANQGMEQQLQQSSPSWAESGSATVHGSTAQARLHLSATYQNHSVGIDFGLNLQQHNGSWCVPSNGMQADPGSETIDGKKANG
ncbi:MAG TPA: hypothetical protein VHW44_19860 [Pseudonocardiaceae bacterium]|nr:hypothetical protein [Pseudonocardiaceae bacterium]